MRDALAGKCSFSHLMFAPVKKKKMIIFMLKLYQKPVYVLEQIWPWIDILFVVFMAIVCCLTLDIYFRRYCAFLTSHLRFKIFVSSFPSHKQESMSQINGCIIYISITTSFVSWLLEKHLHLWCSCQKCRHLHIW